jgi:hypothetical protein
MILQTRDEKMKKQNTKPANTAIPIKWYNNLSNHKKEFIERIREKKTTPQDIIKNITNAGYKISAQTINEILELK